MTCTNTLLKLKAVNMTCKEHMNIKLDFENDQRLYLKK